MSAPAVRPRFADVAEQNLDGVHRYLCHLVGDRHLADDLTSATFERALRDWPRYDPARGRPSVWLVEVARRVALDHFRRDGRRRAREERYAAGVPDSVPGPGEPGGFSPDLRGALARLTRAERELIALRVVLGMDAAEAGRVAGCRHPPWAPGCTGPSPSCDRRWSDRDDSGDRSRAARRDRLRLPAARRRRAGAAGADGGDAGAGAGGVRRAEAAGAGWPAARPVAVGVRARAAGSACGRRGLMVGVPLVAGVIALAVAIPVLGGREHLRARRRGRGPGLHRRAGPAIRPAASAPEAAPAFDSAKSVAPGAGASGGGTSGGGAVAPAAPQPTGTDPRRAQQLTATTRVQVKDVAALSRASAAAMGTVRRLGGFTASSEYAVPNGGEGTNRLVFRVPVARTQDALAAFGRLGVVTAQSASIVDLTARLDAATRRIALLEQRVADLRAQVAANPGDAAAARDLARAEAELLRRRTLQAATRERTRLATLNLTLTTERAAPAGHGVGPFRRAGLTGGRAAGRRAGLDARRPGAGGAVPPAGRGGAVGAGAPARGRSHRRLMGSA